MSPAEAVGEHFDPTLLLSARERTLTCAAEIAARILPGMREPDAVAIAEGVLSKASAEKGWHRIVIRFGTDTTKAFTDLSDPSVVLQPSDIFFLDLGPVFDGHEGDFGRTHVVGDDADHLRCAADSEAVFHEVADHWRATGKTGQQLYAFAAEAARRRGWVLNLGQGRGHRIGDFPHAYHHRGKLADYGERPSPDRWILEIALRHPVRPFGAFFEDLLGGAGDSGAGGGAGAGANFRV